MYSPKMRQKIINSRSLKTILSPFNLYQNVLLRQISLLGALGYEYPLGKVKMPRSQGTRNVLDPEARKDPQSKENNLIVNFFLLR